MYSTRGSSSTDIAAIVQSSRRRLEDPSVYRRICAPFLVLVIAAFVTINAHAAPRDNAANKKIDEAVNQHYLATNFDKAEAILTGTIKACEDKCSGPVLGRAWMYVGIVRGSGKGNQKGAREAFAQALAADPAVKLDDALATPDTKKSFEESGGGGGAAEPPAPAGGDEEKTKPPPAGEPQDVPGDMDCTPDVFEVETRRPIPVSCSTDEDATKAELFYKEFAGEKWESVKMRKKGDAFQAEIPCSATQNAGVLRLYVKAKAGADDADNWGTRKKPVEINIVQQSDAEPPSFPDADPPDRCAETVECPPDFPGCKPAGGGGGKKDEGDSCDESEECMSGLSCVGGVCAAAKSCEMDSDCPSGAKCVEGSCEGGSGSYKKNWIGLHFAHDFAIVGGEDVCTVASQTNNAFACFVRGTTRPFPGPVNNVNGAPQGAQPGTNDRIATGFSQVGKTTMRVLASFDRALIPNLTVGGRVGFAFNGGPKPPNGKAFLPLHVEARGQYFFGKNPLGKKGLRPYVHAGGGLAQVDAKLAVKATDCGAIVDDTQQSGIRGANPAEYELCQDRENSEVHVSTELDAYKKLGQGFIDAGGGAVFALTPNSGVQLNLNVMFMLPNTGLVLEPSLGYVMGL
jgi:hypothetical protein